VDGGHFIGRSMQLNLQAITKNQGAAHWLYEMTLSPQPGAVTVLLGATQAGKTSLMRIMAGLDKPTTGQVRVDGADVTGLGVRHRNVAMVYQQFINYPSMTVAQNIASPLKLRPGAADSSAINAQVKSLAQRLHIDMFLDRLPAELSGGQQQRVALARALAKNAPLMLLDEPLVNLDYKLREELREELTQLFAAGDSTVVYATTEPAEALLLGGFTAVMDAGELLQYGPTAEVFHRPHSLRVARAFSDPPMNLLPARPAPGGVQLLVEKAGGSEGGGLLLTLHMPTHLAGSAATTGTLTAGLRAGALRVQARAGDVQLPGVVELAEISGSDTFVHVATAVGDVVAQLSGVHVFDIGSALTLHFNPQQVYVFGADGNLLLAPDRLTRQKH
jgi:glycerol transport system ATP-binding protein